VEVWHPGNPIDVASVREPPGVRLRRRLSEIEAEPKRRIPDMTAELAAPAVLDYVVGQLKATGYKYIENKDFANAQATFKRILDLGSNDANVRFIYAQLIDDGSHKKRAEARDLMLSILDDHPELFTHATDGNFNLIRNAAVRCSHVGPFSKAIELFRALAHASNLAS